MTWRDDPIPTTHGEIDRQGREAKAEIDSIAKKISEGPPIDPKHKEELENLTYFMNMTIRNAKEPGGSLAVLLGNWGILKKSITDRNRLVDEAIEKAKEASVEK
ncbi:hypothetical protein S7711_10565 [Stachybotrys chartarum IBT 7711]|uniref:Uncharacterized protein n=1 Tax=Stachybotrys chartarum (strain CBS 109288 / IBT 7711) TaxID=1280523 RepID=A0A084B0Z6_STACB|nr:hypothetical protein S7711_10565 [Stachybotrys chartarum IBT 7711]KFA56448.1 hypothetical protein S40293_10883 [Stachybotrys chartarum IBT 40293]KFA71190.1 hypothetical protein S40288_10948 [Stachybotrys chartarum IBT 40288]